MTTPTRRFDLRKHAVATYAVLSGFILCVAACQYTPPQGADVDGAVPAAEHAFYQPAQELGELFRDVQMQQVFPDSKTFADSRAKQPPAKVLADYKAQKSEPGFSLEEFVNEHFAVPQVQDVVFAPNPELPMAEHLRTHWQYLVREADQEQPWSSLIPLPNAYVVPGGRFREIYYWDSYFTMHGLVASGREQLMQNMLDNFAWLIDEVGHVPNGNRSYYLSRSQPPFFAAMVSLAQQHGGDEAAVGYLPALLQEHRFWMSGAEQLEPGQAHRRAVRLPNGALLNRYYDDLDEPRPESYREDVHTAAALPEARRPQSYRDIRAAAESGWDFSSRWLGDQKTLATIETTQIIPVDLNSLLYHLESTISQLYATDGDSVKAESFAAKAQNRADAINHWLWNSEAAGYGDYHFVAGRFTPVQSLAMVYPLYFGVATDKRAAAVAELLQNKFLQAGGLVTSLNHTGEQWDYPNGWAPLQWLAIKGLRQYGHLALSEEVSSRWLKLNRDVFARTGRMMEKYNVVDTSLHAGGGEYPLQDGFGWTNGVVLGLLDGEE